MEELVAAIKAAIDEDERLAERAAQAYKGSRSWRFMPGNEDVEPAVFIGDRSLYSDYRHDNDDGNLLPSEVTHIARHDPARVLRRVAADRKILELHQGSHECTSEADNCVWSTGEPGDECETVRVLAEGYDIEAPSVAQ